jgi:hypothetical protein
VRKFTKEALRQMGRLALEMRDDHDSIQIRDVRGAGIIHGSRLQVAEGATERTVAVRTSLARELGFARRPEGKWVTLPKVDEVLVVVPFAGDAEKAEVLAYDAQTLIEAFDAALAHGRESAKRFSTAPVFIALDGEPTVTSGLKSKAKWQMVMKRSELSKRQQVHPSATAAFLERVKREYAEMNGIDVSKVVIEFKIIT